jgi:hypothetical protein
MYVKYPHIERLGHKETEGLTEGNVFLFSKLDGTNGVVWFENGVIHCGSRTVNLKDITNPNDNQGFKLYINTLSIKEKLLKFFKQFPTCTIYGEWLRPHSLKTYRVDVWNRFWIFDIFNRETGLFVSYKEYESALTELSLDFIPPIVEIKNPSEEQIKSYLEKNTYLIEDGKGLGEGIVAKNYEWKNPFGRQVWAKAVRNEFRELNQKEFGHNRVDGTFQIESAIAEKYVTQYLVDKTKAKILVETENRIVVIPRLLNTVFYDLVQEELWSAIKEFHNPTINFKKLQQACFIQTKKLASELF